MTNERMFYIAYTICDYIRKREMQNQFEDYEFCMYVSELAKEIECAIKTNNDSGLKQYYETLYDELENLIDTVPVNKLKEHIVEVKELINLLDEWKKYV